MDNIDIHTNNKYIFYFYQNYGNMSKEDRELVITAQLNALSHDAQNLHLLTKKRKETVALIVKKKKDIEHVLTQEVCKRREDESKKRIHRNYQEEQQAQRLTSALMMELMEICSQEDVPNYVMAISKVLDNYQGGINTIRSNSTWLSEIISQLTDQMRNFDASQKKLEAKCELILEKVKTIFLVLHNYKLKRKKERRKERKKERKQKRSN